MKTSTIQRLNQSDACQTSLVWGEHGQNVSENWHGFDTALLPLRSSISQGEARIKWFEDSKGQPSFNHAWFIWNFKHEGPPTLAYGPSRAIDAALK